MKIPHRKRLILMGVLLVMTVLITALVILGVLALPSLFFSPKAWPGLLILLILGSLGFALWTRGQDNRNHPENQGDQK